MCLRGRGSSRARSRCFPSSTASTSSSARTTETTSRCSGNSERIVTDLLQTVRGCTFDDFLLTPQYSVIERRDPATIDLSSRFSEHLTLKRPIVSANMDTITRAEMAIAVAEEGGIGIIDRGFRSGDIEPQVREVERVKRRQHGTIGDPYTIAVSADLSAALDMMRRTGVGSLVVVDSNNRVAGLLTSRDLRFVAPGGTATVADR